MYCSVRDFSYEKIAHELCDPTLGNDWALLSIVTIAALFRCCREITVDNFLNKQAKKPKLWGIPEFGPPITVLIDEAKFGKRRYNYGKRVENHWVLG